MNKKFTKLIAAIALLVFMMPSMAGWGQTRATKTEGFETATASTTYNSTYTINAEQSDCGIAWSIYYGCVSTNNKINGNNSAQMRWYSSATTNYPYMKTTTAIDNLSNVSFKAKVGNTNVKMDVKYSANGTDWLVLASAVAFENTTQATEVSYEIPSGGKFIQIGVSSSSTAPSSSNYSFIIDDVVFTYTASGSNYTVTFDAGDGTFVGNNDFPSLTNTKEAGTYTLPSATAASGYTFDGWTTTGNSTPQTGSYTVSGDVAFTAHYTQNSSSGQIILTATNLELNTSYPSSGTTVRIDIDNITYAYQRLMKNGNNIQAEATNGTLQNTTPYSEDIVSVAITHSGTARATTIWGSSDGNNWTSVETGSGSITADFSGRGYKYFKITRGSNAAYWTQIVITCEVASSVAKPQFSPAAGIYTSAQTVTISAETGATIYYTTDGSQPSTNSTLYNEAISISSNTTLKAIAVVNGESSNVASATYTFITPLTTMQAIFDNATATPASHEVAITFNNWVISGQNGSQSTGSGANRAWLTDNNGKGCLIYDSNNPGLMAGNVLNGTVICNLQIYNGSAQITGINSNTTDINGYPIVSTGGSVTPVVTAINNLSGVNTGSVITLNQLRCTSVANTNVTLTDGTNTINAKKTLYSSLTLVEGGLYNLTGVYDYSTSSMSIYPRGSADVQEVPKATLTIGDFSHVSECFMFDGNYSITVTNNAAQVYVGTEVSVSIEMESHYVIESFSVKDGNNETVEVTVITPGVYYSFTMPANGATISITARLAAQYALTYGEHSHVSFTLVDDDSEPIDPAEIYEGTTVHVETTVDNGYNLQSLSVTYGENQTVEVINEAPGYYSFIMPSANAVLSSTVLKLPTYTLVTSADQLVAGKSYIIVATKTDGSYFAMGTKHSSNYRLSTSVTPNNDNTIYGNDDIREVVLGGSSNNWTFKDNIDNAYLKGYSGSNLYNSEEITDDCKWTIIMEGGFAKIRSNSYQTYYIMFNANSPRFACYAGTQRWTYLYVKDETPATDSYTLTITGYGNDNTVKTGWNLIASPVATNPTDVENMTTNTFDLYGFNGSAELEWENWKKSGDHYHFNLVPGKGYLYAHSTDVDLIFTGTMATSIDDVVLPYDDNSDIKSFYLAGNSLQNETTFYVYNEDLEKQTVHFLTINGNGDGFVTTENNKFTAQAMQGFFVQSNGEQRLLSIDDVEDAKGRNVELLNIMVNQNRGTLLDNAIVSFGNAPQMSKFYLTDNSTRIFIPQNGEEMAVVRSEAQGEMPVNFKAKENGTYTLSIDAEGVEMNYLHLIDNMTGMDIDLLQTPSYTFNATTRDYESRFRLVFAANNEDGVSTGSTAFAFFSNGNWIINNAGEATLQVVDVTGRILSSETVNGSVSTTINAVPGVYMLRLINGENVNVQKIVVR